MACLAGKAPCPQRLRWPVHFPTHHLSFRSLPVSISCSRLPWEPGGGDPGDTPPHRLPAEPSARLIWGHHTGRLRVWFLPAPHGLLCVGDTAAPDTVWLSFPCPAMKAGKIGGGGASRDGTAHILEAAMIKRSPEASAARGRRPRLSLRNKATFPCQALGLPGTSRNPLKTRGGRQSDRAWTSRRQAYF